MPGIMEFMTTRPYISDWNEHYLGMGGSKLGYALMRKGLDLYNAPVREAVDLAHGKFSQDLPMPELVKKADEVTSVGVQAGEGWLLTAEIPNSSNRDARTWCARSRSPACRTT